MAGIIVGIVALPLAIAFGIASGVSPEQGLITAIIAGFIVSFLGGSNVQIGGPTGAFIVIVYGIIQQFGIEGLAIATVMAGIMLVLMGVFKLGTIIRFIPYPIVVGFTSGIALTIFTTQIKDLFGLTMDKVPADFISKWIAVEHTLRMEATEQSTEIRHDVYIPLQVFILIVLTWIDPSPLCLPATYTDTCAECGSKLVTDIKSSCRRNKISKFSFTYSMCSSYLCLNKPMRFKYRFTFFFDTLLLRICYCSTQRKYSN